MIYVDLTTRFYSQDAIKKVAELRKKGVNITDLFYSAVMTADIEKLLEIQKVKRELKRFRAGM